MVQNGSNEPRRLSATEAKAFSEGIHSEWHIEEAKIFREFRFPDFASALSFANRVGVLAETANHHPDMLISYGKTVIELSTHSVSGLSEKDFALAKQIDGLLIK